MITVLCDDIITTKRIPEGLIDLTITSPPYNMDKNYNGVGGVYNDSVSWGDYMCFTSTWLEKVYNLSAEDGRLCLNIPLDNNVGGQKSAYADIVETAKRVGWKYHTTIVWHGGNIHKRTAWGSFCSPSAPWVYAPVEMIVVMYKGDTWKKRVRKTKGVIDITKEEFIAWTNGMWDFKPASAKRTGHPAPFNIELPTRCMKLFSYVGDMILDPFNGSGTTMVACGNNRRRGIGVDTNPDYCKLAQKRIETETKCVDAEKVL